LVCERHLGIGISIQTIENQKIPIPKRDIFPVSIEEKIICLADNFFCKEEGGFEKERDIAEIREGRLKFNDVEMFDRLAKELGF